MTCANVLVGLGKDREGMEAMRLSVSLREGSDQGNHWRGLQQVNFNPRSGAARHIALHELLGVQIIRIHQTGVQHARAE